MPLFLAHSMPADVACIRISGSGADNPVWITQKLPDFAGGIAGTPVCAVKSLNF
jgi:hypothetical protein